jgi:hypothetical protein
MEVNKTPTILYLLRCIPRALSKMINPRETDRAKEVTVAVPSISINRKMTAPSPMQQP